MPNSKVIFKDRYTPSKAAKQGHVIAQTTIGALCFEEGSLKGQEKAFEWFEKAAQQGGMLAQTALGLMYTEGIGVQRDFKKAFYWNEKAAIRHLTATTLYHNGYDVATIQAILRHKSPNTTERYLKTLGLEKVKNALDSLTKIVHFEDIKKEKAPNEAPAAVNDFF